MASKAYLVMGDNGETYEDHAVWPVKVFFHSYTARVFMGQLKERIDWLILESDQHEELGTLETAKRQEKALRAVTKLDPSFPDYHKRTTTYYINEIPIEERN
jgi:hypothetical protein